MIVAVGGLIGTGKSTLVNKLANNNGYTIFEEPVDSKLAHNYSVRLLGPNSGLPGSEMTVSHRISF